MENSYIIPARYYRNIEHKDMKPIGWIWSERVESYYLEDSVTYDNWSGVWLREYKEKWVVTDCNYSEPKIIHEGTMYVMELINLTRKLWNI